MIRMLAIAANRLVNGPKICNSLLLLKSRISKAVSLTKQSGRRVNLLSAKLRTRNLVEMNSKFGKMRFARVLISSDPCRNGAKEKEKTVCKVEIQAIGTVG